MKASSEKDGKQAEDSGLAESVEAAPEKTVITWENAAVEQAVRAAAEIPEGEITQKDLDAVTYLDFTNAGMKDLSVLKRFPALKSVDLTGNGISSLEMLKDMTWLEGICLDDNQITYIQPLRSLTSLVASVCHMVAIVVTLYSMSHSGFSCVPK